jgi:hypothetical protein
MMRKCVWLGRAAGAAIVVLGAASAVQAGPPPPIYSFETLYNNTGTIDAAGTRPDRFHANGGGTTIAQSNVGVTQGSFSMQFSQVAPATFTGAISELVPAAINDPITTGISFDITIPTAFAGNFARIGITEFGANEAQLGSGGGSAQTTGEAERDIKLAPGTYNLTIPLIARNNPITFDSNVTFASCFGSDPNTQMTPTSFQFYINKSETDPLTVYIDNVHVSPDFLDGDANLDNKVDLTDFTFLASNFNGTGKSWAQGDFNGDKKVDLTDFTFLASNFNKTRGQAGSSAGAVGAAVPEPASLALLGVFVWSVAGGRRRRSGQTIRTTYPS